MAQRFVIFALAAKLAWASSIISECNSKLPMSLSTVISDLEAEGVNELGTACFLTSRGVTAATKAHFFGIEDESSTAFGTDAGVCMALTPPSIAEVASTAVACGGNIVYYADEDDLSRGEGLFDSLGPAMERILNEGMGPTSSLIVVSKDPSSTKAKLEEAAALVLSSLVSSKEIVSLEDVFHVVEYVTSPEEAMKFVAASEEPAEAQAIIANTVASDFWQTTPLALSSPMSAKDLAAARQLGPAARKAAESAIASVKAMAGDQLVSNFGDLCSAAIKRAVDELDEFALPSLASSSVGRQIRENMKEEISAELATLSDVQLEMLKDACFAEFKQNLSKLRISPNLANDMQDVASKSVADFAKRAKKIPGSTSDSKTAFQSQLKEFCSERLLAARAGGQFRPVPRKGVTIGLHWLLPKPFGNDFRQEPWMVHATDNLVYVPQDKITDVSPEEVAAGDWRNKIVPSPAGNEMLYMQ
mmetsp:Transcript_106079/g.306855  ORF Transcript_106079/g.306855 Transcript_106079/m.306855 type:complete len:474 (-) Transcript_106079:57-1478(-)